MLGSEINVKINCSMTKFEDAESARGTAAEGWDALVYHGSNTGLKKKGRDVG